MFGQTVLFLLLSDSVLSQDYVSECPAENGLFADALQCDRYYECIDGEVTDNLCPDGLVYDETSEKFAKCGFPTGIDCTGRKDRQPAQPTPGCPHQHGYYAHPDPEVCDKFNFCVDGNPNTVTCAGGLIFDPATGQCAYSDQTNRPGCTSNDLFGFRCPDISSSAQEYSRHSDPEDCQNFYLCIEGKARRNGCQVGMVFNPISLSCERQDKVEGPCSNYYNATFLESLKPTRRPEINTELRQSAVENRRRPSRPQTQNTPRRQQRPEQALPQQLADLENFGQQQFSGPTFAPRRQQFQPREPTFAPIRQQFQPEEPTFAPRRQQFQPEEPSFSPRRQQIRPEEPTAPRRQQFQPKEPTFAQYEDEESADNFASSFVRNPVRSNSDRLPSPSSSVSQSSSDRGRVRSRVPIPRRRQQVTRTEEAPEVDVRRTNVRNNIDRTPIGDSRRQFSRQPVRTSVLSPVEAVPQQVNEEEASASFGRRRQNLQTSRRKSSRQDLLNQVELELARRESLAASSNQDQTFLPEQTILPDPVLPVVSRGRVRARGRLPIARQTRRNSLQVVDNERAPLETFAEDQDETFSFNSGRQRNRG